MKLLHTNIQENKKLVEKIKYKLLLPNIKKIKN